MPFLDFLIGSPGRMEQIQKFTQPQQQGLNKILAQSLSGLKPGQFGAGFEPIAQQARTQFQQQTIPSIAERFTSMGAQRSSAFPQLLGQAAAGLEGNLAAQKSQFGLQDRSQLMQLLGMGLTPQFDTAVYPATGGLLGSLAQGLGYGLGSGSFINPMSLLGLLGGGGSGNQQQSGSFMMQGRPNSFLDIARSIGFGGM